MSAVPDYEVMHHLIDRLSPAQVRRLRALTDADPELHGLLDSAEPESGETSKRLLALAGLWEAGPADAAINHDELIRQRLRSGE
jgi:hypothetical protein